MRSILENTSVSIFGEQYSKTYSKICSQTHLSVFKCYISVRITTTRLHTIGAGLVCVLFLYLYRIQNVFFALFKMSATSVKTHRASSSFKSRIIYELFTRCLDRISISQPGDLEIHFTADTVPEPQRWHRCEKWLPVHELNFDTSKRILSRYLLRSSCPHLQQIRQILVTKCFLHFQYTVHPCLGIPKDFFCC